MGEFVLQTFSWLGEQKKKKKRGKGRKESDERGKRMKANHVGMGMSLLLGRVPGKKFDLKLARNFS